MQEFALTAGDVADGSVEKERDKGDPISDAAGRVCCNRAQRSEADTCIRPCIGKCL